MNQSKKRLVDDVMAPSRNDEYLLYQTLVGSWPLAEDFAVDTCFRERIKRYMLKAVREAKEKSSWANPSANYEAAVGAFVDEVLVSGQDNPFLSSVKAFSRDVARAGMFSSLSQTLLKLTCPGVPDLYQGTELWDLSLVDPDNRRPVDYSRRAEILNEMETWPESGEGLTSCVRHLVSHMSDGRIKMYLTWKILNLRKQNPKLFQDGDYLPLQISGSNSKHFVAFARRFEGDELIIVVPRLSAKLFAGQAPNPSDIWKDTRVELRGRELANENDDRSYRNVFTAKALAPMSSGQRGFLPAAALFELFPVAALISEPMTTNVR
jgi:(1->4)-alpha-D-glucan 1-alpha-D-glucosylmutase